MPLTATQAALLQGLRSAVSGSLSRRIVYCSEYSGYLPFGYYHWVTLDDRDISLELSIDFASADFDALEQEGLLRRVGEWTNPKDELETKVTFEIASA